MSSRCRPSDLKGIPSLLGLYMHVFCILIYLLPVAPFSTLVFNVRTNYILIVSVTCTIFFILYFNCAHNIVFNLRCIQCVTYHAHYILFRCFEEDNLKRIIIYNISVNHNGRNRTKFCNLYPRFVKYYLCELCVRVYCLCLSPW